jgi:hypothetical protein
MTEIVFAQPRHLYQSYTDFWRLVELSEYPTCYVDEIDFDSQNIYITAPWNGDAESHISNHTKQQRNCHIILWNLERPGSENGAVMWYGKRQRELMQKLRVVDECWVSDRQLAVETGLRYVTLGSHYGLGEPSDHKIYHAVHMSYAVPRRQTIYNKINNLAPNGWGDERHQILQQSFFAVNIHQDNFGFVEPLRFALFAAYGLPTISEHVANSDPYWEHILWADYADIPDVLNRNMGQNYKIFKEYGLEFRKLLCEDFNFRKMVDEAVFVNGLVWR